MLMNLSQETCHKEEHEKRLYETAPSRKEYRQNRAVLR